MPRITDGTTKTKGTGSDMTKNKEPPRLSTYLNGSTNNNSSSNNNSNNRKKSSTITPVDTTSVTSTSSHAPDLLSVFQKKPNLLVETNPSPPSTSAAAAVVTPITKNKKTTLPTTTTTTTTTKTTTTATPSTKPKLDPWEWHGKLVSNEGKRSKLMEQRYQSKQIQYAAIQQLVTDAIQETSLAYRWTTSITKIQDEFAQSLTLKETMNWNDPEFVANHTNSHNDVGGVYPYDVDDPEKVYNQLVETVTLNDTLPEKVRTIPEEGDDEETENSLAGSFNIDHERNAIHEVAVMVTTATPSPTKRSSVLELLSSSTHKNPTTTSNSPTKTNPTSKNDTNAATSSSSSTLKHQPPVFAISFPNPYCCNDAYYILHKQHEFLQQTFSRNGVNQSSMDKIQQMKELAQENESKLHELAGTILQDWKVKEEEIQKLWNNYLSIAIEVLSSVPKLTPMPEWPKSTDSEQKMKYTTGDVWIAEILYRTAVKRQEINFVTEEMTLQSLCEMVKDGEYQRRTRLRKHIQVDVLQKHASIFERVQLAHAEAIQTYLSPTTTTTTTAAVEGGCTDEYKYLENDTFHQGDESSDKNKKDNKKKKQVVVEEKKKLSIKEQIQEIASFIGTTTVWDAPNTTPIDTPTMEANIESSQEEEKKNCDDVTDAGAVDVDKYVGSFDDEDEDGEGDEDDEEFNDLPLLKDAIIDPYTVAGSPGTSSKRKKRRSSQRKKKPVAMKTTDLIGLQPDDKFKIQNPVVLDQQSSKHAYFMDQLLFSGSLLESHYVQYASVVGLDDNYSSYLDPGESKSSKKDDVSSRALNKHGLVIVTSDDIIHLFEIPTTPTISSNNPYIDNGTSAPSTRDEVQIFPGCNPEDALLSLLKQSADEDLILKEQQDMQALLKEKSSPVPTSPSKLSSFLRPKATPTTTKEENKCFQFHNMAPSLSMPLSECTIRQSLSGQSSVRISHNSVNPRIASNKLIFATVIDQNAFLQVAATRTDVTLWDLR